MIQVYKIVKGLDRVPSEMFFKFCDASDDMRQTRWHNWKIFKPQHTLDVRKHTFSVRIINDWNSLSAEVVHVAMHKDWSLQCHFLVLKNGPPLVTVVERGRFSNLHYD